MLVGGDEKPCGAAGGVEYLLVFFGVDDLDHEVDDVARRAELPGVALGAENGEHVLECVAQPLAVIVSKLVDNFKKSAQGFGVAVRQAGVLENIAKQLGDARVTGIRLMASS